MLYTNTLYSSWHIYIVNVNDHCWRSVFNLSIYTSIWSQFSTMICSKLGPISLFGLKVARSACPCCLVPVQLKGSGSSLHSSCPSYHISVCFKTLNWKFEYNVNTNVFVVFLCLSLFWRLMIQWHPRRVIAHLPAHVILWIMNLKTRRQIICACPLMLSAWWAYAKWKESIW